jgi:HAMP domain-containing protein
MSSEAQACEQNILETLRRTFEAQGLTFVRNPGDDVIPSFLGGYKPDAIAVNQNGGGIVFEVKQRRSNATDKQLAEIAQKIAPHKNWEFRAVFTGSASDTSPNIPKPTTEQIDAKINELATLVRLQHYDVALVAGWAILESMARLVISDDAHGQSKGLTSIQAVQSLAQEGYLENEVAQRLREMAGLRDAVVHGDLSAEVSAQQVEDLQRHLQTIASAISGVSSKEAAAP